MNAKILVSDPWDFGTQCGVGPFVGEVLAQKHGRLLIRLRQPIAYGGKHYEGVIASRRHFRDADSEIESSDRIPANLLFVISVGINVLEDRHPATALPAVGSVGTNNLWTPDADIAD